MHTISYEKLVEAIELLVQDANYFLPDDIYGALRSAHESESVPRAAAILGQLVENASIAAHERLPLCQDTGVAVFFADIGQDVCIEGGGIDQAIQEGTRRGYRAGGLRMSMVSDPLERHNTGDNTPAIVHYRQVPGDKLHLFFCPKGGGCENMSRVAMLTPGSGKAGVIDMVIDTVLAGGGKPCPPLIIGVGIGGNFEYAPLLAKRALLRTVGERHPESSYADLERFLCEKINDLGIGPMGLGGDTTAFDVFIETAPCHIASLPVAVNIQCHSARHRELVI